MRSESEILADLCREDEKSEADIEKVDSIIINDNIEADLFDLVVNDIDFPSSHLSLLLSPHSVSLPKESAPNLS